MSQYSIKTISFDFFFRTQIWRFFIVLLILINNFDIIYANSISNVNILLSKKIEIAENINTIIPEIKLDFLGYENIVNHRMQINLNCNHCKITLSPSSGISIQTGELNGDSNVIATGTLPIVQAALRKVKIRMNNNSNNNNNNIDNSSKSPKSKDFKPTGLFIDCKTSVVKEIHAGNDLM